MAPAASATCPRTGVADVAEVVDAVRRVARGGSVVDPWINVD
jgi:hypothetical protein